MQYHLGSSTWSILIVCFFFISFFPIAFLNTGNVYSQGPDPERIKELQAEARRANEAAKVDEQEELGRGAIKSGSDGDVISSSGSKVVGGSCSIKSISSCGLNDMVHILYKNLFVIGGIAGVIMISFRGVGIVLSTVKGDVVGLGEAIRKFENVLVGLGILSLSYIILNTINPDILSF